MTIQTALATLKKARCPEDIFGIDPAGFVASFREWALIVHEDKVPDEQKLLAHEAFLLLSKWRDQANLKIVNTTYGDSKPSVLATFKTKTAAYEVTSLLAESDIADLYEGVSDRGVPCVVKVCRSAANNDLMKNEADILGTLPAALDPKHTAYFPNLLDSFECQRGSVKTRVNVFSFTEGAVSLKEVRDKRVDGLDPKDAAWMWNRVLEALHLLHGQGYVHANLTPDRFLIVPETHQGILIDFCYARKVGQPAKAISPAWKELYPAELLDKKELDFGTDLYHAAGMMNFLLGAKPGSKVIPAGTPLAIAGLLRACWLGRAHRTSSAHELHKDFKAVRKGLGWKTEFRPFTL